MATVYAMCLFARSIKMEVAKYIGTEVANYP